MSVTTVYIALIALGEIVWFVLPLLGGGFDLFHGVSGLGVEDVAVSIPVPGISRDCDDK
jgi:hypothetical protein